MIVAIGLDVDPTFPTFVAAALSRDVPVGVLNLRAAIEGEWRIPLPPGEPAQFWYSGHTLELGPKDGYFCRIIDMSSQQRDVAGTRRWIALTRALGKWLDQVPGRVANRSRAGFSQLVQASSRSDPVGNGLPGPTEHFELRPRPASRFH